MRYNLRFAFGFGLISAVLFAAPLGAFAQDKDIQKLVDEVHEKTPDLELKDLKLNDTLLEQARKRVEKMELRGPDMKDIGDVFGYDFSEEIERHMQPALQEVLYVFVSFSMSDSLIREYIQDIAKTGGIVVISGLHNNNFKETVDKIEDYARVGEGELRGGVMIDPKAFETFNVSAVPTIVLSESELTQCLSPDCVRAVPRHDRMMGAVSIEYALKAFARDGDMKQAAADKLTFISSDIYSYYEDE